MTATDPKPGPFRRWLRRLLKLIAWTLLAILAGVVLYLIAALVLGLMPVNEDFEPPERGIEVFIRSNGVHTDFVLPTWTTSMNWAEFVPLVDDPAMSASAKFVAFGWGDRGFFLNTPKWEDLTAETAIRAMFLPSETAMHVSYWQNRPSESDRSVSLLLTRAQHDKLVEYITKSLVLDGKGKPKHIAGSGYRKHEDTFYEAKGSYHLVLTCNEWTNRGLAQIGVRAARWSPFDSAIFYQLGKIK